jgi:hypothetical protein
MRKLMIATLGAALLAAMAAAQATGSNKPGVDPTVTSTRKMQDSSRGVTKPRDTTVATPPVQKPAVAGVNSGARQRQGLESNGTDVQGRGLQ